MKDGATNADETTRLPSTKFYNGKVFAEFYVATRIVQDAQSYQRLLELKERAETVEVLRQRLATVGRKKERTADQFFTEFFAKNDIPAED